jgi:predicted transcriptional regulator
LSGEQAIEVLRALASPGRIDILRILGAGQRNITEIARATGLTQPTVTQSIKRLQRAGLVDATLRPVPKGHEKLCNRVYDNVLIRLPGDGSQGDLGTSEVLMPVGRYRAFEVHPPCGLVSETDIVGLFDDPQSFTDPRHVFAQLVWLADGFLEYTFPSRVPPGNNITRLELSVEICSEAPGHDAHHPSDITVWINGHEIGTWRCPGDFGTTRGRLTPRWWSTRYTQYGLLKHWTVTDSGSYLDGSRLSNVALGDIEVRAGGTTRIRFGIKPDAERKGGMNLFGGKFGNYGQDMVLKLEFEPDTTRRTTL